jgi:hypothetical protein
LVSGGSVKGGGCIVCASAALGVGLEFCGSEMEGIDS